MSRIIDVTPRAIPSERGKILVPRRGQSRNKSLLLPRAPRGNSDVPRITIRHLQRAESVSEQALLIRVRSTCRDTQILPGDGSSLDIPSHPWHRSPPSRPPASPRHPLPLQQEESIHIPEVFHVSVRSWSRRCARRNGSQAERRPRDRDRSELTGRAVARVPRADSSGSVT